MSTDQQPWTVDCHDFAGRDLAVSTFVSKGRIVLIVPAGEVAMLDPDQTQELTPPSCVTP